MSVGIIAALPREIAGLVRGSPADKALLKQNVWLHRLPGAIVVAAGIGSDRVTLAVQAALRSTSLTGLVSTGLAGSCQPSVEVGTIAQAGMVIDAKSGERFPTTSSTDLVLVSTTGIASISEKARLQAAYGASMVDMEAATVGRLARAHGLEFQALKGISDAHDFELESLGMFADATGQFRTIRFAAHTALRPHTWKHAMTLGRNSSLAVKQLNEALVALINTR